MDAITQRLMMGAAGAAGGAATYVEDVFSTWLYTGNGSTQTITNGIDLSGKGGLVWIKGRNGSAPDHLLYDTSRGATNGLVTNSTNSNSTNANTLTSFTATGFNVGSYVYVNGGPGGAPTFPETFASWTFRKAAKFFDVVTYTGTGAARTIAHNLGSVPGCIIVKRTDGGAANWFVYHRSLTSNAYYLLLDNTQGQSNAVDAWNSTTPTATQFSLSSISNVNASGATYVAYLFAHDAGGFGDSGNESIIKCGVATDSGSGVNVDLGWEPQWVLVKRNDSVGNWRIIDNMRGWPMRTQPSIQLFPNTSGAEDSSEAWGNPTATGFLLNATAPGTYIYIAIRRGPMKTPTDATKVLTLQTRTGNSTENVITVGFPPDFWFTKSRNQGASSYKWVSGNRLIGLGRHLSFNLTDAELNYGTPLQGNDQNDVRYGDSGISRAPLDETGTTYIDAWFRRAPGFFDVVAYTGNGSTPRTITHNLGVVPELVIIKSRSNADATFSQWTIGGSVIQAAGANRNLFLNATDAAATGYNPWYSTLPTSTVLTVSDSTLVNGSSQTYIAYLFASCPGVSKVGSYTGTGTTLQVNCGFTNGARFVLIKRTDSTGDWYVWDTARGIIAANDPYLLLNSTAAEVTNTDYIDPYSAGFEISSTAPAAINASGGSYIYLAIA